MPPSIFMTVVLIYGGVILNDVRVT